MRAQGQRNTPPSASMKLSIGLATLALQEALTIDPLGRRLQPDSRLFTSTSLRLAATGLLQDPSPAAVAAARDTHKTFMDRRIQTVQLAVEKDSRREWSSEALGDLVNLSPSRLRHLFKAETGKTPTQFLKAVRLKEAETLLCTTFLSVKEIMNRVGFLDESHFGYEFKKVYGLAPSKYRSSTPRRDASK